MNSSTSICPICQAPVNCSARYSASSCWCMQYPTLPSESLEKDSACLCETCLRNRLTQLGIDWQTGKDPIPKK
ncbi:MAG: hypothetical protein EBS31_05430 [Burkholderiaceae bacterium]|nr:hypothetical protein [Burkholderiaceae bacterium]